MSMRHCLSGLVLLGVTALPAFAQTPDSTFFETKIRPVLAENCYRCHSATMVAGVRMC